MKRNTPIQTQIINGLIISPNGANNLSRNDRIRMTAHELQRLRDVYVAIMAEAGTEDKWRRFWDSMWKQAIKGKIGAAQIILDRYLGSVQEASKHIHLHEASPGQDLSRLPLAQLEGMLKEQGWERKTMEAGPDKDGQATEAKPNSGPEPGPAEGGDSPIPPT